MQKQLNTVCTHFYANAIYLVYVGKSHTCHVHAPGQPMSFFRIIWLTCISKDKGFLE